ncbi:PREDICTED: serine/arginine repetitive matrix protein 1-like [Acropora digitifera]|uniref:serine/arginine repetitive matrix protein 1-like n=1 Tax=Acropora digitifera TaxID=70779 RepID=UPI00077B1A67|nr:PREDICTED: serine/arginine repetitive matrix protein 1-like [Acropora digitifera]
MFYSVDILTRKGRLGLIWLAATYGESRRGMTQRDYKRVNISRACRDIIDPVVPFALRLSSNLMVGVVRIYREQTRIVWVEAKHVYKTIKDAYGMRIKDIDLANPTLREEAITDSFNFSTDSFRLDIETHPVDLLGTEGYFTVNGSGYSPPAAPPVRQFSPPSLPGTPSLTGSPGWLPQWRTPSGSDHDMSPFQARIADITIPDEVDYVRKRKDEPITIPGEVDITGDLPLPDIPMPEPPRPGQMPPPPDVQRRSPRHRSRSPRTRSRSPRVRSRSPRARSKSPRARSRSPRARSKSPRARSRSPHTRSKSPRTRSKSPRARSKSPSARSRSPRAGSKSPRARSKSPSPPSKSTRDRSRSPRERTRSPRRRTPSPRQPLSALPRQSPIRPSDDQVVQAPPSPPLAEPVVDEPSLADVLMIDEVTGQLIMPGERDSDLADISPTNIPEPEFAVPFGYDTPGAPAVTGFPSSPRKAKTRKTRRRRILVDRMTQLSPDVIKRNVHSGGQETLCERRLDEHYLKSGKDLFMEPITEALRSSPFIEVWKANAFTLHSCEPTSSSSESEDLRKESSLETLRSPLAESAEVARGMETPSEKEIPRTVPQGEGSGLFERTDTSGLTPDIPESGVQPMLSFSGDGDLKSEIEMDSTAPRTRSSSILRSSLTGLLSPIQEPSDLEDYMGEIGDLPTLAEQTEVTKSVEEEDHDVTRLLSKLCTKTVRFSWNRGTHTC